MRTNSTVRVNEAVVHELDDDAWGTPRAKQGSAAIDVEAMRRNHWYKVIAEVCDALHGPLV